MLLAPSTDTESGAFLRIWTMGSCFLRDRNEGRWPQISLPPSLPSRAGRRERLSTRTRTLKEYGR